MRRLSLQEAAGLLTDTLLIAARSPGLKLVGVDIENTSPREPLLSWRHKDFEVDE